MRRFISLLSIILLICGLIPKSTAQSPQEEPLSPMKYGRDNPFAPVTDKFSEPETIESESRLEGILWDEKQPLALIGGVIVKVGGKTSQGTVIKIEKEKVTLQDEVSQYELRLGR